MNQILLDKASKLKEELDSLPEVKELERLNEDAIRYFGENSDDAKKAQKELHLAKLELDKHELVIAYNKQFKIVREIYDRINEEIFNPFN